MTFSEKALGNGWHDQASRLVGMHGILSPKAKHAGQPGFEADAAARQAALTEELETAAAQIARLERRLEQEAATTKALRDHIALLDKQFEDAERRADELETELAGACDNAALHDNASQSLQVSLDLAIDENTQLAQRLEQSDAALAGARAELARLQDTDECRSLQASFDRAIDENAQLARSLDASEAALGTASTELARLRTTLAETASERTKLASELFETTGKRLNETAELREQLEAMSVRAETAERLLTDARECLLTRTAEGKAAERARAEIAAARRDADGQIKQLQDLLCVKQCQINEIDQSRSELVSATGALLRTCQNRDAALVEADKKIDTLTKRFAQLEAAAARKAGRRKAATRDAQPRRPAASRAPADNADDKNRIKWAELAIELAKLVKLKGHPPAPLQAASPTALLASTITF
jgi:chromosome segregation ATPase